jgi:hypothetical protein
MDVIHYTYLDVVYFDALAPDELAQLSVSLRRHQGRPTRTCQTSPRKTPFQRGMEACVGTCSQMGSWRHRLQRVIWEIQIAVCLSLAHRPKTPAQRPQRR